MIGDTRLIEDKLIGYGFSKREVKKIVSQNNERSEQEVLSSIDDKFRYFSSLGFKNEEINKIIYNFPRVLGLLNDNLDTHYEMLDSLELTSLEKRKVVKRYSHFYSISKNKFDERINYFLNKGFLIIQVGRMVVKLPSLLGIDIKKYDDVFSFFESHGYSSLEIKDIVLGFPCIFSYSLDLLEEKFTVLSKYFSLENIKRVTCDYPAIFGSLISSIDEKLKFVFDNNLNSFIINNPKDLMQSIDLTKERMKVLERNNMPINEDNIKLLYMDRRRFNSRFLKEEDENGVKKR